MSHDVLFDVKTDGTIQTNAYCQTHQYVIIVDIVQGSNGKVCNL